MVLVILNFILVSCNSEPTPEPQENTITVLKPIKDTVNIDLKQYANVQHLINPNQLQNWLKDTTIHVVILDARNEESFGKGHLKNAQLVQRADIASKAYPYKGMMLGKEAFAKLLSKLGATAKSKIVLYDDIGNVDAARLLWMLIIYGHEQAYLLNGGFTNIQDSSLITKDLNNNTKPSQFVFEGQERKDLLANKEDILKAIEDENIILVDCRTPEEFSGETLKKDAFRAGHIPTAINIEHSESIAYERAQTFRDYEDLKKRFEQIPKDKEIITYCQSGVRSAHSTFVLKELLGYERVANYDGSWVEWSYYKNLPITKQNNIQ